MIQEASVYALKKLPAEQREAYGVRVLTMRKWPRGIRRQDIDLWMPSAAPSLALLAALHLGRVTWEDFLALYCLEQECQQTCHIVSYEGGQPRHQDYPKRSIDSLRSLEELHGTLTLLCWESHQRCHRYTLKALVAERTPMTAGGWQ